MDVDLEFPLVTSSSPPSLMLLYSILRWRALPAETVILHVMLFYMNGTSLWVRKPLVADRAAGVLRCYRLLDAIVSSRVVVVFLPTSIPLVLLYFHSTDYNQNKQAHISTYTRAHPARSTDCRICYEYPNQLGIISPSDFSTPAQSPHVFSIIV